MRTFGSNVTAEENLDGDRPNNVFDLTGFSMLCESFWSMFLFTGGVLNKNEDLEDPR